MLFLLCIFVISEAAPSPVVFANGFGAGWSSWSWNITLNTAKQYGYANTNAVGVTFNTTWAGFSPGVGINFNTAGYKHLSFMVRNNSNGDDLWLFAANPGNTHGTSLRLSDYSPTDTFTQGQWTWIRVPIKDLGLGSNPVLSYFAIQSGKTNASVDFDEIRFEANALLFENNGNDANSPIIRGPAHVWNWGSIVRYPEDAGSQHLSVAVTQAWGGVQIQDVIGGATLPSSDYSAVSMYVCAPFLSGARKVYVAITSDANVVVGNYIELSKYAKTDYAYGLGSRPFDECYNIVIPFKDFQIGNQPGLGGVVFTQDIAGGWFTLNSIRFIEGLRFPLYGQTAYTSGITSVMDHSMTEYACPDGVVTAFTGEQGRQEYGISTWNFSTFNSSNACVSAQLHAYKIANGCTATNPPASQCVFNLNGQNANQGADKIWLYYDGHPGIDYVANGAPVFATASGVVSVSTCHNGASGRDCTGSGVVKIEHVHSVLNPSIGGLITSYNHLSSVEPGIDVGTYVVKGQKIGTSGSTGVSSPHLHLSVLWSPFPTLAIPPQYIDPYGWNGNYQDPYPNAKNVCLWDAGC